MRLEIDVLPDEMEKLQECFKKQKPYTYQGKKYLILSGGEIAYKHDTKTWRTNLILSELPKSNKPRR